jgi:hypothetical protein
MKQIFSLLISLCSLAAMAQPCCSFNSTTPVNPASFSCSPSGGYTINVPGFTTTSPCTATLSYQVSGAGYVAAGGGSTITLPILSPGSHTIHFKLICSDGTVIISTYVYTFTVLAPTTPLHAKVCDAPSGSINKGCVKTFYIVDQNSSTCPNNGSISFPNMCGTTFQFLIYRSTTAPLTGSYPLSTAISGISMYPSGPGTCSPAIPVNTWFRIPGNPFIPNDINLRSAPMPSTLPVNTATNEKYYVICYINNPCCYLSGYAIACPAFQILAPTIFPTAISAFVCSPTSPIAYPQTDYHQCCEKKFILRPICGGTAIINASSFHYHWIILKSPTGTNSTPSCMAEVVDSLILTDCPGSTITDNIWYKFGNSTNSQLAPSLPALSPGYFYMVSCFIEIPCSNTTISSNFATPQVFRVLTPPAPTPVITWSDPSGLSTFTTASSGIITVTRCAPPAANITLSASGPSTGSTVYEWYINSVLQSSTGFQLPPISAIGTYTVYVITTTTDATYPSPGCRVKSEIIKVKIIANSLPLPVISGPNIICTTNSNGTLYTLSTTASGSLLWSNGATTSSINISVPGTYTVSSTLGGCISTSAPFVVTGNPCNCHTCAFSNGAVLIACDGNLSGVPRYKVTITLNNQSGCPGNFIISMPTLDGTLTAASTSTFFANTGSTTYTFYFTSTQGAGHGVLFVMIFTLLNGVSGSLHHCIEQHQIVLPPGC